MRLEGRRGPDAWGLEGGGGGGGGGGVGSGLGFGCLSSESLGSGCRV